MATDDMDISKIAGNAPDSIKRMMGHPVRFYSAKNHFGDKILEQMTTTEISILKKAEEPLKEEGRVVFSLAVTDG
jgi:acyl-coenzyme A thioesterase 13